MHTRIFHASNYIQYIQHLAGLNPQRQHTEKMGEGEILTEYQRDTKLDFWKLESHED